MSAELGDLLRTLLADPSKLEALAPEQARALVASLRAAVGQNPCPLAAPVTPPAWTHDDLLTVDEASSATYQKGTDSTSAGAITTGEPVLVLGTTSGTTITAAKVIVQPAGGVGSETAGVLAARFLDGAARGQDGAAVFGQ